MKHMTENKLFTNCQFGFREKRICILQLLDVLDDLTKAYDENKQTDVIYIDIKKAFDTVPHRRLLLKLQAYGFGGEILAWIKDFLTDRRQKVMVNGKKLRLAGNHFRYSTGIGTWSGIVYHIYKRYA